MTTLYNAAKWQCRAHRKLSGPHICGDAMDIEPETCRVATGSWRKDDNVQVSSTY